MIGPFFVARVRVELKFEGQGLFHRSVASFVAWIVLITLSALAAWLAHSWAERNGYTRLDDAAARQLDLYAAVLENELGKHAHLPRLLDGDAAIGALLDTPPATNLRETINRRLTVFNAKAVAAGIFIADAQGLIIASSDWYRPDSIVGKSVASLAYFSSAIHGDEARRFGTDVAGGATSYFFAQPFRRDGRILGVVVVKTSLDPMESTWVDSAFRPDSEKLVVVDDQGIVIISSIPGWKFKSTRPLAPAQRAALVASGTYPTRTIEPLGLDEVGSLEHGARLVGLPVSASEVPALHVAQERQMPRLGWRLVILSDISDVLRNARYAAWGAAALAAFAGLLCLYLLQRRSVIAHELTLRRALQRAYDQLELKVLDRTAELSDTNRELLREVGERKHAEEVLHEAQDELVQAGKLAMLGQMAAGMSHEIGQPLTALRALSENARVLLQRGRQDEAAENLVAIASVTERMGHITAQLKLFARKTNASSDPVRVAAAAANARMLLEGRIRAENVDVLLDVPTLLLAQCNGNRLEQVLMNLMANALDAMKGCPERRLTVRAATLDRRVVIRVADTGPGIPSDALPHLFEPFFTTKPPGEGLGLGLVISANIVREFGGTLRAVAVGQGAAFEFDLNPATEGGHV